MLSGALCADWPLSAGRGCFWPAMRSPGELMSGTDTGTEISFENRWKGFFCSGRDGRDEALLNPFYHGTYFLGDKLLHLYLYF